MKRYIYVLIFAAFLCGLTACSNKDDQSREGINSLSSSAGMTSSGSSQNNSKPTSSSSNSAVANNSETVGSASNSETENLNNSRVLIAYFTVPEAVSDTTAGASVLIKDGEKFGNTEYVAKIVQQTIGGDLFKIETEQEYPTEHSTLVDQAADEQNDDARPALKNHIENIDDYDTIILGYPNWWADLPMPVYTFLEEYDFGGKTIIPFVTHGGSGFSSTRNTISSLQENASISENSLSLSRNEIPDCADKIEEWANSLGLNAE